MSTDTTPPPSARRRDAPPFRYGAALANRDRAGLAGPLGGRGHLPHAEPERAVGRPGRGRRRGAQGLPAGHVPLPVRHRAARRAPAGLHRHRRAGPLPADDRPQRAARDGLRRVRAAGRAVRRADRHAPAHHHRAQHRALPGAAAPAGPGPRRPPLGGHHRRRRSTAGPSGSSCRSSTPGTTTEQQRARPIAELEAELAAGTRPTPDGRGWSELTDDRAAPAGRLLPAGLRLRGAGQLVPRPGHGAGQRGGHRRRAQRARQLPGVPPQPEAVDDADHRLRRPAGRRPGPAGLAGLGQGHAAQLDRSLRGRERHVPDRRRRRAGIEVFTTRPDTLFGATYMVLAPEHPLVDADHRRRAGRTASTRAGPAARPPRPRRWPAYRAAAARKSELDRQENKDKTGVFTGAYAVNPVNDERIPVFVADYVLMGYGTGAIMAVPGQDQRDWDFATAFGLPIVRTVQPPAGLGGRGVHRRGPGDQLGQPGDQPERAGRGRGQAGDHRVAGRPGRGRGPGAVQAAGLAVLPAALLGRAVPDRLGCRRAAGRAAGLRAAGGAARDRGLLAEDLRPGRRGHRAGAAAVPGHRLGRGRPGPGDGRAPTAARPTRCRSGPARAGTTCATWIRTTPTSWSTRRSSTTGWARTRPGRATPAASTCTSAGWSTRCCTCCTARFWHKVLYDLGHVSSEEPFRRLFNQGYIQAFAYTDARGTYVPAEEVVEASARTGTRVSRGTGSRSAASTGRWASRCATW